MLTRRILLASIPLTVLARTCTPPTKDAPIVRTEVTPYKTSGYRPLVEIPDAQQPWRTRLAAKTDDGIHDHNQVRMFRWKGKMYDHPVGQAQYGLSNLASYRRTHERFYLDRAIKQGERLVDRCEPARGAYYYPYPFDFSLDRHTGVEFKAPWYSGMAQGEVLSLFAQLAAMPELSASDRERYRKFADRTFASLRQLEMRDPWVVNVDDGHYWIQEYPAQSDGTSDYTFNGFMFAALGLWDYHLLTRNAEAAQLFDASLTTLDANYAHLRNPDGFSNYCRTHQLPVKPNYHKIHGDLFQQFTYLSGDPRFAAHAAELRKDQ